MDKAGAGRTPSNGNAPRRAEDSEPTAEALAAAGIESQDASAFERIAAIPEKRFEAEVAKPEATTRGLARVGAEYRPQKRANRRGPR
jgi:hypothetical protein